MGPGPTAFLLFLAGEESVGQGPTCQIDVGAASSAMLLPVLPQLIVQEPINQPYGVRDCAVRDPAGDMIRIQQLA